MAFAGTTSVHRYQVNQGVSSTGHGTEFTLLGGLVLLGQRENKSAAPRGALLLAFNG